MPNYHEDLTDKKVVIIDGGAVGLDHVTKSDTSHTMEKHRVNQLTNTSLL